MSNSGADLNQVMTLPVSARVAFALAVAESIVAVLTPDPEGCALARRALDTAWRWLAGEAVSGDQIAVYVDSPGEDDLGIRELGYTEETMIHGLIAVVLAVGLAARRAYENERATSMPSPIWEVDDDSLADIVRYAQGTGYYVAAHIQNVVDHLVAREGSGRDATPSAPILRSDIVRFVRVSARPAAPL